MMWEGFDGMSFGLGIILTLLLVVPMEIHWWREQDRLRKRIDSAMKVADALEGFMEGRIKG